jgi:serine/threonine protein kinase
MSDSFATPNTDEIILARFMKELAERGEAVVPEHSARHPHLAKEFAELAAVGGLVGATRPEDEESRPARLGDFRIVRKMARGGMGDIYEAIQEPLGRRVVVKTIRRGRISPRARERFLREQEVLARLHQTHIVPIYAGGGEEEGALQYFAMPFIEGAALHHVVQSVRLGSTQPGHKTPTLGEVAGLLAADTDAAVPAGPSVDPQGAMRQESLPQAAPGPRIAPPRRTLSPNLFRSVAGVMADVAEALHHAHEAGFLHRDVKPSNIMVDKAGQCWIIDFGLAGYLAGREGDAGGRTDGPPRSEPVSESGVLGTPQYMAPEQFRGTEDVAADVWGLGRRCTSC